MAKSKVAKYKKRRKSQKRRSNPETKGEMTEMAYKIGAGFAGYTAAKVGTRLAFAQIVKKAPQFANHAALVGAAASAAGIYYGSQKWDKISEYHEEISIGAGIALAQTAVQTLLPQYAWLVGDMNAKQYQVQAAPKKAPIQASLPSLPGVPDEAPSLPSPSASGPSDAELDALLEQAGLEEGDTIGHLPASYGYGESDDLDLDSFAGFGDYNESHEPIH